MPAGPVTINFHAPPAPPEGTGARPTTFPGQMPGTLPAGAPQGAQTNYAAMLARVNSQFGGGGAPMMARPPMFPGQEPAQRPPGMLPGGVPQNAQANYAAALARIQAARAQFGQRFPQTGQVPGQFPGWAGYLQRLQMMRQQRPPALG